MIHPYKALPPGRKSRDLAFWTLALAAFAVAQAAVGPSSPAPRMLAAYYGYDNCLGIADSNGVNGNVDEALAAGCNVKFIPGTTTQATNVRTPLQLAATCTGDVVPPANISAVDGIPVSFSGPVIPFGLNNKSFKVTLSDGTRVTPVCVTLDPANELNELETVLLMGQFGRPRTKGGPYPVLVTVETPIYVATTGKPFGEIPPGASIAVGDYDTGPSLLDAVIRRFSMLGETAGGGAQFPNHCQVAFPSTTHVIQMLWSGGVTQDGVNSVLPNQAGLFQTKGQTGLFNLKVRNKGGGLVDYYDVPGVRVLGLADLGNGVPANPGTSYTADNDNYLDVCLELPAGFNPNRIEQVVTNPANSFGLQLFDPSGDTPNPPQTVAVRNDSPGQGN
jgi:hypothetical protein